MATPEKPDKKPEETIYEKTRDALDSLKFTLEGAPAQSASKFNEGRTEAIIERALLSREDFEAMTDEELKKYIETYQHYLDNLAGPDGITDHENLVRIQYETARIMDIMEKDPELDQALNWAVGNIPEGMSVNGQLKEKAFASLRKAFADPARRETAALVFHQMKKQYQLELAQDLDAGSWEYLNEKGMLAPGDIQQLAAAKGLTLSDSQIENYTKNYQQMREFYEETGQAMKTESYGAKSGFTKVVNGKNLIKLAGTIWGGTVIAMNIIANIKDPKGAVDLPLFLGAGAVLAAREVADERKLAEKLVGSEEKTAEKQRDLYEMVNGDPKGWGRFLSGNKYENVTYFSQFLLENKTEDGDYNTDKIKIANFKEFLAKKDPKVASEFVAIAERPSVTDLSMLRLATLFSELKIEGPQQTAKKAFLTQMEAAKQHIA